MLKVAVIGTGNIGKNHTSWYNQNPDAKLVALCDMVPEQVDPVAKQYGVKAYYSIDDLLASEEIDAVSVTTAGPENGGHHYEPVMKCLAAGKHVLVEKPISNDLAQAREMVATAKEKGLLLGVNLNHRFTPAADRAKQLQNEGKIGQVLFVNMDLWINNPNESSPWFHMRALHSHSIDVMRFFAGPIVKVQAFMKKGPGRKIWSNASVNIQFESGAIGHLTGSYDASSFHGIERCEVAGSEGRFIIEDVFRELVYFPRRSPEKMVISNPGGMSNFNETFRNRINKFVEEVQAGGPLTGSGDEGLAAFEVVEAAIRSWENGTVEEVRG